MKNIKSIFFFFYENKNNENCIIIFSLQTSLDVLSLTKIVFENGNFLFILPNTIYLLHQSLGNIIILIMTT